jgi:hypothetical protein
MIGAIDTLLGHFIEEPARMSEPDGSVAREDL